MARTCRLNDYLKTPHLPEVSQSTPPFSPWVDTLIKPLWILFAFFATTVSANTFVNTNANASTQADPVFTLPYYDWGRCPFEGCTYQEWTAKEKIAVRAEPSLNAKVLFQIPRGEKVQALTGVVIVNKPGIVRVIKSVNTGYNEQWEGPLLFLNAGEQLYVTSALGEGSMAIWYKGKIYRLIGEDMLETPEVEFISAPENKWWAKIKDKKGREGWVENMNFSNIGRHE